MKLLTLVPILAVGVLTSSTLAHADSSAELWFTAGIKHKISDDLKLSYTQHLRFSENISELKSIMPAVALSFRLHPTLKLAAGYRFAYKRSGSGDFTNRHRLHTDVAVSHSFGEFKASYRFRLQSVFKQDDTKVVARNRLRLQFRINDATDGISSVESFNDLSAGLEKLRLTVGVGREISGQDMNFFYRYESPSDQSDATLHILGLGFDVSL